MTALGRVLVVRLSALGDVLFALPAVEALARSGLATRLSWLVEDRAAPLLQGRDELDEVVAFPRRRPGAWWRHARALRRRDDDLVVDLQGNLKSRLQLGLLRAPRKVGHDVPFAREGAERALTQRVAVPSHARHRVASHLWLVGTLGVPVPTPVPRPRFAIPERAREAAARALPEGEGPHVVLHPGTSRFGTFKRWPVDAFAALGRRLVSGHRARVVVTGTPDEEALVAPLVASIPGAVHPSPRSVHELAALLARADVVVAADSFPLHLANLLGTPVVGLFGPKDPRVNGPAYDRAEVVRAGVDCSPCTLRRCADTLCMHALEVEAVHAAAGRALAAGAVR